MDNLTRIEKPHMWHQTGKTQRPSRGRHNYAVATNAKPLPQFGSRWLKNRDTCIQNIQIENESKP